MCVRGVCGVVRRSFIDEASSDYVMEIFWSSHYLHPPILAADPVVGPHSTAEEKAPLPFHAVLSRRLCHQIQRHSDRSAAEVVPRFLDKRWLTVGRSVGRPLIMWLAVDFNE